MFDDAKLTSIPAKTRHHRKSALLLIGCVTVVVILAATSAVLLWKYHQLQHRKTTATGTAASSTQTTQRLLHEVGAIYQLPSGEQPTVAHVDDPAKLAGQPFFKAAQQGDYVLVYTKAQMAFLYRESVHKLINVGPITVTTSTASQGTSTASHP